MSLTEEMTTELRTSSAAFTSNGSAAVPFLSSAFDHLKSSASNATSFLNPSPMDLLLVVPRMVLRAGKFALVTVPERLDNLVMRGMVGTSIARATGHEVQQAAVAAVSGAQATAAATVAAAGTERVQGGGFGQAFAFQNIRNFGGVFSYLTSKWALGCFTAVRIAISVYTAAEPFIDPTNTGHCSQSDPGVCLFSPPHQSGLALATGVADRADHHVSIPDPVAS